MEQNKKRAILAVSFGTSHRDTCAKTIEAIENDIREAYPQYALYRGWSSGKIRRKLKNTMGIEIFSVGEALEQMKKDGITEVVVQPTHVLNGIENELMEKEIHCAQGCFEKVEVSKPLLSSQEDCQKILEILVEEWKPAEDEFLLCMGHGTEHHSDFV